MTSARGTGVPPVSAQPKKHGRDARATTNTASETPRPHRAVAVSLSTFFCLARRARWSLRLLRPLAVPATVWLSRPVRENLRANARHIFGRELSPVEHRAFARGVIGHFYDFVVELGRSAGESADRILSRIDGVEGHDRYVEARRAKRGALLVTAHMGAFEVGLAALRRVEPHVHVVFKRDAFNGFESARTRVRETLGVGEAPIDDGFEALVRLRDALRNDHVVVLQGDRAMPGQRAATVPFLHGRLNLPAGPVKLARLTGSPIVPVFVVRQPTGGFRVHLGTPIDAAAHPPVPGRVDPALLELATAIEAFVRRYPTQWLVLDRAFADDAVRAV